MDLLSIILCGIGLAMDASAVSIAKGMSLSKEHINEYAIKLGLVFGFFQGAMPLAGYFIGSHFAKYITSIDHWIAFILLSIIGINMIRESKEKDEDASVVHSISWKVILVLAIATSIDALAVGITLAFLRVNVWLATGLFALITFVLSFICVKLGKKLGSLFQAYAERLGGIILIVLGIKILIEHLFF